MSNLKTTIHAYRFDLTKKAERAAWDALRAKLEADGLRVFETHGGTSHYKPTLDGHQIELETAHLFENQWNTAPIDGISDKGLRVFDWAKDYPSRLSGCPSTVARGHWIEQTPEMREIRRNTVKCRYCGKQEPAQKGYVFCPHCIDSQYLKADDLRLTRMLPIDDLSNAAPLTEAERAHLMPLYKEAQLHGSTERGKARIAAERASLEKEYKAAIDAATTKHDGLLWLMDRGINTGNVIYYSHTGKFSFGWRQPLGGEVLSGLLDIISEFPFPYEIKTDDGRTLSAA